MVYWLWHEQGVYVSQPSHYHFTRESCSNFGDLLQIAIEHSHCNCFAQRHFQHSAGGVYIEQEELDQLREQLRAFEHGELEINWSE